MAGFSTQKVSGLLSILKGVKAEASQLHCHCSQVIGCDVFSIKSCHQQEYLEYPVVVTYVHDSKGIVMNVYNEVRPKATVGWSSRVRSRTAGVSVSVVCKTFSIKEPSFCSSSIFAFFSLS